MSPPNSSRGPYRKPRADIYTVMLALALVAIIIGCVFLYFEVADYGPQPYQLGLAVPLELDFPVALAQGCEPPSLGDALLAGC